jgi:hypothetical protein
LVTLTLTEMDSFFIFLMNYNKAEKAW